MHIVIFGMGAIGGFYGISLLKYLRAHPEEQSKISFVARTKTYETLKHFGAKLVCKRDTVGEIEESIIIEKDLDLYRTYNDLEINPDEYTLVLLCVKSQDTVSACEDIKKKLNKNTAVVSFQNGVENEWRIASILGLEHTIGSLTTIAAETLEPGLYLQKGNYGCTIGELKGNENIIWSNQKRIDYICDFLHRAGIHINISKNIMKDLWTKLVWNAGFNSLSVLYDNTVGQILDNSEKKALLKNIMNEVVIVAKAEGFELDADIAEKHIQRTSSPVWYDFRTSTLQDYQKGKAIEVDDLLGVVVRNAHKHGLEVPYSLQVYNALAKEKVQ